ncbi:MAG: hypothetical protein ABIG10_04300 [bacterium]
MTKLIKKIKTIPKDYFSLNDLKKISNLSKASLKVAVNRLVKNNELIKLGNSLYAHDISKLDLEKLSIEIYQPSYLSFEWVLAKNNILSQKPYHLTLATNKRSKKVIINKNIIIYHHLKPRLFWGYKREDNILIAETEKAFLDLAYLSLNGYAKFDPEEMNLKILNKPKLKKYLNKFNYKKLDNLILSCLKL